MRREGGRRRAIMPLGVIRAGTKTARGGLLLGRGVMQSWGMTNDDENWRVLMGVAWRCNKLRPERPVGEAQPGYTACREAPSCTGGRDEAMARCMS